MRERYTKRMNIPYPPAKRPLPKHAKKVFTGEIFDVYQWEQEMYDGSTVIFEKIKRADTVSVIPITTEQKILISHEEQPGLKPFYGVFGGRIEPEENPLSAAKRELLEETGYQSDKWKLWHSFQPFEKIEWAIFSFVAQDCQYIQAQNLDNGEKIEVMEVDFEKFIKYAQRPDFRDSEISYLVLQALVDPAKMAELKKTIFD